MYLWSYICLYFPQWFEIVRHRGQNKYPREGGKIVLLVEIPSSKELIYLGDEVEESSEWHRLIGEKRVCVLVGREIFPKYTCFILGAKLLST